MVKLEAGRVLQSCGVVMILLVIMLPCLKENIVAVKENEEKTFAVSCLVQMECREYQVEAKAMCDDDGCGEDPAIATARTEYSAIRHRAQGSWLAQHEVNRDLAERFVKTVQKKKALVLLGDSIFESFLGTSMKMSVDRAKGCPEVLEASYGRFFSPLPLALSGDQSQHLLWRLPRELPEELLKDSNVTFLLLIGTNNLGAGFLPEATVHGVAAVVSWLLENTNGKIVVLGLLPRGDRWLLDRLCPPRCASNNKPFTSFLPAVKRVNEKLKSETIPSFEAFSRLEFLPHCGEKSFASSSSSHNIFINSRLLSRQQPQRRHKYAPPVDMQREALLQNNPDVNLNMMPDALHPNAAGHQLFADCILNSSRLLSAEISQRRRRAMSHTSPLRHHRQQQASRNNND